MENILINYNLCNNMGLYTCITISVELFEVRLFLCIKKDVTLNGSVTSFFNIQFLGRKGDVP